MDRTFSVSDAGVDDTPWMRVGDYDLFEELGRGGMGVVYRGRQRGLKRPVAVKMLLGAVATAAGPRQRFFREAEAVARLRHPRIVAVHEVGESEDGVPWYSMDLIAGQPLDAIVRAAPLIDREAAACLREIALAVAHAHERGVLHRDLKPSNILIDGQGAPHVTDFGIASRLGDATPVPHLTHTGQSLGSPGYAAPELALGSATDVRTDVYGLGAILYHCLTGRPPHSGPSLESVLLQVREIPPVPPRRLNPTVSRDLETICLKSLAKLPEDRFGTAAALAEDLGRYLDGQSIRARPIGPLGRLWRWSRRRPVIAGLLGLLSIATLAGLTTAWLSMDRQRDLMHRDLLASESRAMLERPVIGTRGRVLAAIKSAWDIHPSAGLRSQAIAALSLPDWTVLPESPYATMEPADPARSGDGTHSARVEDGAIHVTVTGTGRSFAILPGYPVGSRLKLNQTASQIAVARPGGGNLEILSLPDGETRLICPHPHAIESVDWSGDLIAASCVNRYVFIWSAVDGRLCQRLIGHDSSGVVVRFRPGGSELVTVAQDNLVRLWNAPRGSLLLTADMGSNNDAPAWWMPDGSEFRFGTLDRRGVRRLAPVWPVSVRLLALPFHEPGPENMQTMDISPDGTLISTSDDDVCRLWDVVTGRVIATIPKGRGEWNVTRFSPDGQTLWISGWDRGMTPWPLRREPGRSTVTLGPPGEPLFGSGSLLRDQSPDGRQFVLGNNDEGVFLVCDRDSGVVARLPHKGVLSAALSSDGRWVATSSYITPISGAKVWSLPDGRWVGDLPAPGVVGSLYFSPDDRHLTLRTSNGSIRYRTGTWQVDRSHPGTENLNGSVLSPEGSLLACFEAQDILLRDPESLREIVRLPTPPAAGWLGAAQISFSADGSILAVRAATGALVVWDLPSLRRELGEIGLAW